MLGITERYDQNCFGFDPNIVNPNADMLAAMGTELRLRIMRLLLSAHPHGMVAGEIGGGTGHGGSPVAPPGN